MVGQLFTIALLRVNTREGLMIKQMPVPENHLETSEVNWLTIQQVVFVDVECATPSMADGI